MSADLLVIVDDNSTAFSYSSPGGPSPSWAWDRLGAAKWYEATSHAASGRSQPSLEALHTGPTLPKARFKSITELPSLSITDPPTYKQWFSTPNLPDSKHTITFRNLYRTTIDYAVIRVGNNISLNGQTIIVDDNSPLIQYSGKWSPGMNQFSSGGLGDQSGPLKGYPYDNTSHTSSNPGDTFTFRFSGTSIAVYGIFSWYHLGSLTTTYTIDDGPPHSSSISVNTSSFGYVIRTEFTNYLYFRQDSLPPGNHTLLVNITEANNQAFTLDYITYKLFDTTDNSNTTESNDVPPVGGSHKSVSTGTLVGGVLGGLSFGVLVAIFIILFIRRQRRARKQIYAHNDAALPGVLNDSTLPQPGNLNDANILTQSKNVVTGSITSSLNASS